MIKITNKKISSVRFVDLFIVVCYLFGFFTVARVIVSNKFTDDRLDGLIHRLDIETSRLLDHRKGSV